MQSLITRYQVISSIRSLPYFQLIAMGALFFVCKYSYSPTERSLWSIMGKTNYRQATKQCQHFDCTVWVSVFHNGFGSLWTDKIVMGISHLKEIEPLLKSSCFGLLWTTVSVVAGSTLSSATRGWEDQIWLAKKITKNVVILTVIFKCIRAPALIPWLINMAV